MIFKGQQLIAKDREMSEFRLPFENEFWRALRAQDDDKLAAIDLKLQKIADEKKLAAMERNLQLLKDPRMRMQQEALSIYKRGGCAIKVEVLVVGWAREFFKDSNDEHSKLPPMCLLRTIGKFTNSAHIEIASSTNELIYVLT